MSHPDTTEALIPIDMMNVKLRASSCWMDDEKFPESASYNEKEEQK
jgi:hypothetical protein